jgi:hypothetical protein
MVIYNQRSLPDPDAGEACGECALATGLGMVGIATNPLLILAQLRAKFGHTSTADGTDQNELGWYCSSVGVDWTWSATGGVPGVLAGLRAGHPVLVAIHDNNSGDPDASGTFRHWILAYRDNGNGSIQCANSWASTATAPTGRDVAYPNVQLAAAMFESMEIHRTAPVNPSPVGDDMTWDINMKRGVIFGFRTGTFGKWPGFDEVESYATQIHDDGSNLEAVLDALRVQFQKDGGILMGDRVTALEARPQGSGGGISLDQVKAEIAKAFQAGAAGA